MEFIYFDLSNSKDDLLTFKENYFNNFNLVYLGLKFNFNINIDNWGINLWYPNSVLERCSSNKEFVYFLNDVKYTFIFKDLNNLTEIIQTSLTQTNIFTQYTLGIII